jgi:hypothetical protein
VSDAAFDDCAREKLDAKRESGTATGGGDLARLGAGVGERGIVEKRMSSCRTHMRTA